MNGSIMDNGLPIRSRLRGAFSGRTRRRITDVRRRLRSLSSDRRGLPDFIIIGTQRGGTSSLFRYLSGHPQILRPLRKETEYFSGKYRLGLSWYRAHFPLRSALEESGKMTFEATPDYMFDPRAADRASRLIPHAKIIALLREPVSRAYSQYRHSVRLGFETLTFKDALAAESERCDDLYHLMVQDEIARAPAVLRHAYVRRGHYAEQLAPWLELFGSDRVFIETSERFFAAPAQSLASLERFLGLDEWLPGEFPNYSAYRRPDPGIDEETIERLRSHYGIHNEHLKSLVGRELGWGY